MGKKKWFHTIMGHDKRLASALYIGTSYVYFFLTRDQSLSGSPVYLKVGFSSNPISRMMAIQTGCPTPIFKFSCVQTRSRDQAKELEYLLHSGLEQFKSSGEWFRIEWDSVGKRSELFGIIELRCRAILGEKWVIKEIEIEDARRKYLANSFSKMRPNTPKKVWKKIVEGKIAHGIVNGKEFRGHYDRDVSDVDLTNCFS